MSYKIISSYSGHKLDCLVLGLDKNKLSVFGKQIDEALAGHLSAVIKQECRNKVRSDDARVPSGERHS